MSELIHTPGPWEYEGSERAPGNGEWFFFVGPPLDACDLLPVASIVRERAPSLGNPTKETMEADAALVAASPDLLSALELSAVVMSRILKSRFNATVPPPENSDLEFIVNKATHALRAARGGSIARVLL